MTFPCADLRMSFLVPACCSRASQRLLSIRVKSSSFVLLVVGHGASCDPSSIIWDISLLSFYTLGRQSIVRFQRP